MKIIFTLNLDSLPSVNSGLSSTWRVALRCFVTVAEPLVLDVELDAEKNKQFIIRFYCLNLMPETYMKVLQMLKLFCTITTNFFFKISSTSLS